MALESVINIADQFDSESESQTKVEEKVSIEPETEIGAAENRAVVILKTLEAAAKLLADSRFMLDEDEIASGTASLAPVIQKYNLAGDGSGNIPFAEEVAAGLYLGGLWKRFKRVLAQLRAADRAEEEAKKNNDQASSSASEAPVNHGFK